jgi:hypothetical protein
VVFWDGDTPSPEDVLAKWKSVVGFGTQHGSASVGNNGPSGSELVARVLAPLGIAAEQTAFTDAVPWFFVKSGKGSQGEAIAQRFAPIAEVMKVFPGSLPPRPSAKQLVATAAADERRTSLRQEILDAGAQRVITLGQEALDVLREISDEVRGVQTRLAPDGYGTEGEVVIKGHVMHLIPLCHPGFVRQTRDVKWRQALAAWREASGG